MAALKPVESQSGSGLSRWQLAVAIGAPLLLGAGAVYLWNKRTVSKRSERKAPEGSSSPVPKEEGGRGENESEGLSLLDRAQSAKNKGNKFFKAGKFEQAIQCYTEAISLCPLNQKQDLSTFYQNRAAAFEQLVWSTLPSNCVDVTAVCILEGFQNQQSMLLADRVLKLLGKEKAKEKYKNREPLMPSPQFIKSYFNSFTDDIISQPLLKGENPDEDKDKEGEAADIRGTERSGYQKAKQYMEEENYDKIISECTKEIETKGKYVAEALLLRATFYLLIGNATAAQPDLDMVVSMKDANVKLRANALIKRGSMYMQQQQSQLSTQDFNMAADIDPQNADVYHHRGQLKILLDNVEEAVDDFDECIRLRPDSALAQAQKCFALLQWKQDLDKGLELISKAIEIDNKCDFAYETMGTIEVQRGNLAKAIEMFSKAINLAKSEMEMAHLYSLCDAAYAQTEVAKKYGLKPPTL
ncbi:hypothetical protein scyTo_0012119 [Scyliorhinus torazame]|uniref:Mitochondrial import receptor subunit TOM70 n=1 Tax=Scyliorhinus torazame TaxID=75743 RepID=A0A401P287_SCYTO|nr:hypothetical protein [Scyliorhinus torazame]